VIALLAQELKGQSRKVYLCGESFGGCLALKIATKAAKLLKKLILINPASSFNQRPLLSLGIGITQMMPDFIHGSSALTILPFLAALGRISRKIAALSSKPCNTSHRRRLAGVYPSYNGFRLVPAS
jgi:pimeloyl-ACP methyl ester carboxylesterase